MTTVDDRPPIDPIDRPQPSSRPAERDVIGSALCSTDALSEIVAAGLRSTDLYHPGHEQTWDAILALSEQGRPHDPLAVAEEMRRRGTTRLMPIEELSTMYGAALPLAARDRALTVMEYAARRRAITAGAQIVQMAYAPGTSLTELEGVAYRAAESIAPPTDESTWSVLDDVLEMVHESTEKAATEGRPGGIEWGYADVDAEMAPLVPGEFAVISAFSGGGKSVVACGIALHAAVKQGRRVLVHAMEMTRLEVGQRWVASEAKVELGRVINGGTRVGRDGRIDGGLTAAERDRIDRAYARLVGAPLVIDEVETVSLASLRASVRRHRPDLVVVDQIPTMSPTDPRAPREQQVSGLSYGLKRLGKAEGVAVLACCQLNANPTRRTDKTPTMHDLRESQAIVQAANTLVILSDPEEVEKGSGRLGEIDWIVRKQRQGRKDVIIPLARQFHYSRITDMERA